ncbi:Ubiquitin carboxyl-terminal hydrolase 20 [Trichinella britovi]|uniref:Ubiquitin carboxyl-terminal hydrolase n=1 Tax=Trichinella britovi TaxID=45882 RepID=A0A0V1CQD8_TRIBR|nr:Ubiquitin carboxyl-terminal hydrolase 20 [Trichinella britovi]
MFNLFHAFRLCTLFIFYLKIFLLRDILRQLAMLSKIGLPVSVLTHTDEPNFGLKGIQNLGNTCYLNAAVQALSNCPPLTEYMRHCSLPCSSSPDGNRRNKLASEFQKLIDTLWDDEYENMLSPIFFVDAVLACNPHFRLFQQQDTQEFLRFLLNELHEQLKRPVYKWEHRLLKTRNHHEMLKNNTHGYDSDSSMSSCSSFVSCVSAASDNLDCEKNGISSDTDDASSYNSTAELMEGSDNFVAEEEVLNKEFLLRKPVRYNSIINDIFSGQLVTSITCLRCKSVSHNKEIFQDISLSIPSLEQLVLMQNASINGNEYVSPSSVANQSWLSWLTLRFKEYISRMDLTLSDCLKLFFSPEDLRGDDMYRCDRCKSLQPGVKICRLLKTPQILCIHIKRFRHEASSSFKLNNRIDFPLEGLDLSDFVQGRSSDLHTYNLVAVISHSGNADGGHYVSYCMNHSNYRWYLFDDETVTAVDPCTVENVEAYVLFYEKTSNTIGFVREQASALFENSHLLSPVETSFYYISMEWVIRLSTFAEPGPVNNYSFLCRHGRNNNFVNGKKLSSMHNYCLKLSPSLWNYLRVKFGGGPVCHHLKHCIICSAYQEAFESRRKHELSKFYRYQNDDEYFISKSIADENHDFASSSRLICTKWLRRWKAFVFGETDELPGPIDNSCMVPVPLRNGSAKTISIEVSDLLPNLCFCCINNDTWRDLISIYGGGPEICCQNKEL